MKRVFLVMTALALVPLATACGDATGDTASADEVAFRPEVEERFRVGETEGGRWDSFSRLTSLAFDDQGNLYILDADEHRVTVVDPDGNLVRQFGSRGDGPGQFRMPQALAVLPTGEVAVSDAGHRGVLMFGADGAYQRAVPFPDGGMGGANLLFAHGDDGIVFASRGITVSSSGGRPVFPTDTPIRRLVVSGAGAGEVQELHRAWLPPRELSGDGVTMRGQGGAQIRLPGLGTMRAFEPQLHMAALPDGRVAVADSSAYRVTIVSPQGGPAGVVERPVTPTPVGEREQEAERARRLEEMDQGGGPQLRVSIAGPGGTQTMDQGDLGDMLREQIENLEFWHEIPVIQALAADQEGRLWVQRRMGPEELGSLDVITAEGELVGSIPPGEFSLPNAFGPGGLVAWIERDELEIPRVRVGRLAGIP